MAYISQQTETIKDKRDPKEKTRKHVNLGKEIKEFIEGRIRELEFKRVMNRINKALSDISPSEKPAWRQIREDRSR